MEQAIMNRNPRPNDEHPDEHAKERAEGPQNEKPAAPRDIDQEIRINELTEKAKELGLDSFETAEDISPDVEEAFLESLIAYESAPLSTPFDALESQGVQLPPPEKLGEIELNRKLWQVINTLAARNTFVTHTNHLNDRELYDHLWNDSLRELGPALAEPAPPRGRRGKNPGWVQFIDPIGSGSEADTAIWLRFYATKEDRARWAKHYPGDSMPASERPPHDRDRLLPKAPFPFGPRVEGDDADGGLEVGDREEDSGIDPYAVDDSDE